MTPFDNISPVSEGTDLNQTPDEASKVLTPFNRIVLKIISWLKPKDKVEIRSKEEVENLEKTAKHKYFK